MNFINLDFLQKHKSLVKNTIYVFAQTAIQRILGLATVYILVRTLNQNQFGDYQFVLSVIALLTVFSLPGLHNAVMQSTARGMLGTFRQSLRFSVLSSCIGSLILICIGTWYFVYKNDNLCYAFFVASFLFPFSHGLKSWQAVKTGQEKFLTLLVFESLFALITALLLISILLAAVDTILWPVFIILAVPTVQNLIFTGWLLKKLNNETKVEKESIKYGVKTTIYSSMNIVANHLDKILIYGFFSPSSLALYFAAERVSELTKGLAQNIAAVMAPRFANTTHYTVRLNKILNKLTVVMGVMVIVFAFTLLPWIIIYLFGDDYVKAIPYAQALVCSVSITSYSIFRGRFIKSKLDEKNLRDITVSISLIRIVSSVILVPIYGILGAIISTFIYRISSVLVMSYIIKTRYK